MKLKKILLSTAIFTMAFSNIAYAKNIAMDLFYNGKNHKYDAKEVKININEKEIIPKDIPPVIIDGRTMLPMRLIAEELGCEVLWNNDTKQVFIINEDYTVAFTLDSKTAVKNGTEIKLDVPAMIVNDRTLLPVRALANALDLDISWNEALRTVQIGKTSENTTDTPSENDKPTTPQLPNTNVVRISNIYTPEKLSSAQVFTIESSTPMYSFDEVLLDDKRVVIDIQNASIATKEEFTATNSAIVNKVRLGNQNANNIPVVRVVLDLNYKQKYKITQSDDKTKIYVTFEQSYIEDISLQNIQGMDRLEIVGSGALGAKVSSLSNPNKIIVDIENVQYDNLKDLDISNLEFIKNAEYKMLNEKTFRVSLETADNTEFNYNQNGNKFILDVKPSTLKDISYDSEKSALILKKSEEFNFTNSSITKSDTYTEVILPKDLESVYGYGTIKIGNNKLQSVQILTRNGQTVLRFTGNSFNEYVLNETSDSYEVLIKHPKEIYDKIVLLDAGHGGSQPGASANGLVEKTVNLQVITKVKKHLENSGIKVYMTRESDVMVDNNLRAKTANEVADLMVSVHMNSLASNASSVNGTETLYQVHSNDKADMLTSKKAAEVMQAKVLSALGTTNRGIKQRTDLLILNATNVPTVLIEVCFLSNPGDAIKISNGANQEKVAQAIADGIIKSLTEYKIR